MDIKNITQAFRTYTAEETQLGLSAGCELFFATLGEFYRGQCKNTLLHYVTDSLNSLDSSGLVNFLPDEDMPVDARISAVYCPSYAIIGIAIWLKNQGTWNRALDSALKCLIENAFKYGIAGHGYEAEDMRRNTIMLLLRAGLRSFLEREPEYSEILSRYAEWEYCRVKTALKGGNENEGLFYPHNSFDLSDIAAAWIGKPYTVFVYGTLMKGQRAESFMVDADYISKGMIENYGMYSLGAFPGIHECNNAKVFGELYYVSSQLLADLDTYESEGRMYRRTSVEIKTPYGTKRGQVYVYLGQVEGKPIQFPWGTTEESELWYACYGSNLSSKRFACYIKGGICQENGRPYKGCNDNRIWAECETREIPGRMYFANQSGSWGGKGVAFFDGDDKSSKTIMRLYKIRYGQLMQVRSQEGSFPEWYGETLPLGIGDDGYPIYTLTSSAKRPHNMPSEAYVNLIRNALVDECGLTTGAAEQYIDKCLSI